MLEMDVTGTVAVPDDSLGCLTSPMNVEIIVGKPLKARRGIGYDSHQWLVYFMCNRNCQLTHSGHSDRPIESLLRFRNSPNVIYIDVGTVPSYNAPLIIAHRRSLDQEVSHDPIVPSHSRLDFAADAQRQKLAPLLYDLVSIVGMVG
jgi:hypothetical protein